MDIDWITSSSGRQVAETWCDKRPAWLWPQDGLVLVWSNAAAPLFGARSGKSGIKLADTANPIKGQIARVMRLGTPNRSSLSRIQFMLGSKPLSATCMCTPVTLPNGASGLLIVSVDPIDTEFLAERDFMAASLIDEDMSFVLVGADGAALAGSDPGLARFAPQAEAIAFGADGRVSEGTAEVKVTRLRAGPDGSAVLIFAELSELSAVAVEVPEVPAALDDAPDIFAADGDVAPTMVQVVTEPVAAVPDLEIAPEARLSTLFDRLSDDSALFAPLDNRDDFPPAPVEAPIAPLAERNEAPPAPPFDPVPEAPVLYRIVGRRFTPLAEPAKPPFDAEIEPIADPGPLPIDEPTIAEAEREPLTEPLIPRLAELAPETERSLDEALTAEAHTPTPLPDADSVERVSRYNFDELSRILNDRVGNDASRPETIEGIIAADASGKLAQVPAISPPGMGALVNLGGETLVLNRLPLGILVFRDQQVLFANRAITEMIGWESVESLRAAGLASIFPASEGTDGDGPLNHLVQRDGTLVPVTARLQSISWQGKPALMLSASATEVRTGHEMAVKAFAEALAQTRGDGFIEATRNGVVSAVSRDAQRWLGRAEGHLLGKTLASLVAPGDLAQLRAFLERPAKFAETARPCLALETANGAATLMLFAQGQAGIVTGYFAFLHGKDAVAALPATTDTGDQDAGLLARISRGVRRPLNTIVGFSDLIRSAAFGPVENPRYIEYAADIKSAGYEIAALVDELDDYARLKDGRYAARHADIDLSALLESCVARIRPQASAARVLVRSAISERLPKVTADRASLAQALLNLLASAIDQTPVGGSVVMSAQPEDDGSVTVHVRDSASGGADVSERFVVFRDGVGRDGETLGPVRSSVGLALTRSLLAVNAFSLAVGPTTGTGTLFQMVIPADLVSHG